MSNKISPRAFIYGAALLSAARGTLPKPPKNEEERKLIHDLFEEWIVTKDVSYSITLEELQQLIYKDANNKMAHLKFTPATPTFPDDLFLSEPDANGSVRNVVNAAFHQAVMDFGRQPDVTDTNHAGVVRIQSPRKYANQFLKTYQTRDQVQDIGSFFVLDDNQKAAVALGTAGPRFLNAISMAALASDSETALEGGTAYGPDVTFANPVSLWNKKVAELQHDLNVGADGTIPAPPAA